MLTTTDIRRDYTTTVPTDTFIFDIGYFFPTDLRVFVKANGDPLLELTLDSLNDGFSLIPINGNSRNGCTVTTTTEYTTGVEVGISREVDLTQLTDFQRGGQLPPEILNTSLDRSTAMVQQLKDGIDRSIKLDDGDLAVDLTLPINREDMLLGFDADNEMVMVDTDDGLTIGNAIISVLVDSDQIVDKSVNRYKIADGAVSEIQLSDYAVATDKIQDRAVTGSKIDLYSITSDNMALDAITTDKIVDSSITSDKINTQAVNTSKIEDSAVTAEKLSNSGKNAPMTRSIVPTISDLPFNGDFVLRYNTATNELEAYTNNAGLILSGVVSNLS